MITAIDTNVLIALWDKDDVTNVRAQKALDKAQSKGQLVVCGAVFAELLGGEDKNIVVVESFLNETDIAIDWTIDEKIWRSAATAFQRYVARRRKQRQPEPRRLITDFLIGSHSFERGFTLLTFDDRIFKAAFPKLKIVR